MQVDLAASPLVLDDVEDAAERTDLSTLKAAVVEAAEPGEGGEGQAVGESAGIVLAPNWQEGAERVGTKALRRLRRHTTTRGVDVCRRRKITLRNGVGGVGVYRMQ